MIQHIFLILPDNKFADEAKKDIYVPALLKANCQMVSEEPEASSGNPLKDRWEQISKADVVIAHMDDFDGKVMHQLGIAHALSKPLILTAPHGEALPEPFAHCRVLRYATKSTKWVQEISKSLSNELKNIVQRPETAIEQGVGIAFSDRFSPVFRRTEAFSLKSKLAEQQAKGVEDADPKVIAELKAQIQSLTEEMLLIKKNQPTGEPEKVTQADLDTIHSGLDLVLERSGKGESLSTPSINPSQLDLLKKLPETMITNIKKLLKSGSSRLDLYRFLRDQGYSNSDSFLILEGFENDLI